jgi:Transmembrane protein 131-like
MKLTKKLTLLFQILGQ